MLEKYWRVIKIKYTVTQFGKGYAISFPTTFFKSNVENYYVRTLGETKDIIRQIPHKRREYIAFDDIRINTLEKIIKSELLEEINKKESK